jgi:acetyltransferase
MHPLVERGSARKEDDTAVLSSFFRPASVAVVGAGDDKSKLRGKLLSILRATYSGPIYPVHPNAPTVQGLAAVPRVDLIAGGVDLVLIATPGQTVPAIVGQAAAAGAKAAFILSSDVDAAALKRAVGSSPLRIIGPNAEGYISGAELAATFAGVAERAIAEGAFARAKPGRPRLSIVSQSGGLGFALYGRGLLEQLDFRAVVTTGNEYDLECLDFVEHLVREGESRAILMFVEGLKTPARFPAVAALAADRGVPLVVMKVGSSEAGRRAAISHTAHLTGADTAYDAIFARYGVIRVHDMEEMLAIAAGFACLPHAPVSRAAVVTTSGGAGAWAADLCGREGIDVPMLSAPLRADLDRLVPSYGSTVNPVDVTAAVVEDGGAGLVRVVQRLQDSDEVDAVIVNMGLAPRGRIEGLAATLGPLLAAAQKPILFHSHMAADNGNPEALSAIGGHMFQSLRGCALALSALGRYAAFRARWRARPADGTPAAPMLPEGLTGVLGDAETQALLEAYGVPQPPSLLAADRAAAIAGAAAIGHPVALKIQSPDIPHKTEAGGVLLNVGSEEVGPAYDRIMAGVACLAAKARIEGVRVQKMMPKGHELVIGTVSDPDFGALIMLGSGGIYLEVLKDVVFAPAPLSHDEALRMIDALRIAPILRGVRGEPPADIAALASLIVRVGDLARAEAGRLGQLDLNPVFVYPAGEGAVAVDALAVAG